MDKFPQELVFALIFGAVLLVQFVLKRLRKAGQLSDAEPDTQIGTGVEANVGTEPDTVAQRPAAAAAPRPAQTLRIRPPPTPPGAAMAKGVAPSRHDARRFSRRALLGSRHAVQEAIVSAAIVGPCRAHRPHDIG